MQGIGYTNGLRSEKPMVWWANPEINSFRKLPPCPGWEDKRKKGHDYPEELDPWWYHMAGAGAIPFLSEMLPEGEREREKWLGFPFRGLPSPNSAYSHPEASWQGIWKRQNVEIGQQRNGRERNRWESKRPSSHTPEFKALQSLDWAIIIVF